MKMKRGENWEEKERARKGSKKRRRRAERRD